MISKHQLYKSIDAEYKQKLAELNESKSVTVRVPQAFVGSPVFLLPSDPGSQYHYSSETRKVVVKDHDWRESRKELRAERREKIRELRRTENGILMPGVKVAKNAEQNGTNMTAGSAILNVQRK
jgi:hypothetical protein